MGGGLRKWGASVVVFVVVVGWVGLRGRVRGGAVAVCGGRWLWHSVHPWPGQVGGDAELLASGLQQKD